MASKFECPGCGNDWVKKSSLLGSVVRKGYSKLNEQSGRCHNCRYVHTF